MTRVERVGSNRVLLKVIPGPAVGPRSVRAVCASCAHERRVRIAPELAVADVAPALEVGSDQRAVTSTSGESEVR